MVTPVTVPFVRAPWVSDQDDLSGSPIAAGNLGTSNDTVSMPRDQIRTFEQQHLIITVGNAPSCHHIIAVIRKLDNVPNIFPGSV